MKWLVTGATGLIGAALTRRLSARGDEVVAAVRDEAKARRFLGGLPGVSFVAWDVTRPFAGVADDAPDCIVHAASETSSRAFVEKPVETAAAIFDGTRNVLGYARAAKVRKTVFLSTMEVYGLTSARPVRESDGFGLLDPASPRSCYPEAKRLAENLCAAYASEYGLNVSIARLAQTFGPGVVRGDRRVFAQFAEAVLEGRDIVLHTPGRTARCYCYIDDAVDAIILIAEKGASGEAYNVADPASYCTVREMAEALAAAHPPVRVVEDFAAAAGCGYAPEHEMPLSAEKLEALGWRPRVSLVAAYERMLASWA